MSMPPIHRSRFRRRSSDHDGPACVRPSRDVGGLRRAAALSLLLLPSSSRAYLGPTHCTKRGVSAAAVIQSSSVGYSTFNHLLFDVVSIATSFQSGMTIPEERLTFKICRGTTIDLDDSSLPLGFLPIKVPRLTLQCGDSGRRGSGKDGSDGCVIRGGGKRDPDARDWNTYPQRAYKNSATGILGGGSVAQIYVYGESAYEVTLKGLTFDNSVTRKEYKMYNDFVAQFGKEALEKDDVDFGANGSTGGGKDEIEEEYDASVPSEPSSSENKDFKDKLEENFDSSSPSQNDNTWGGADQLKEKLGLGNDSTRHLQEEEEGDGMKPAHRFASVAVRGKGYGDDAGPRLITIEDCKFEAHRGYAILVSPGIQEPSLPMAPKFEFPKPGPKSPSSETVSVNLQSSGQLYNGGHSNQNRTASQGSQRRKLNLLENGGKYIPKDGLISYYDHDGRRNYLDGRRVKISDTEFANNLIAGDKVAGLVTSAYSLTMIDCFFQKNNAKTMVFVYNNDALVDDTIFAENKVEVSTIIMASPKGSKPIVATTTNGEVAEVEPTHIVERTCFLGSQVGMSNVLVTDVENTGFGQRENHASGTEFTWVSSCEGGAAEQLGNDCLETGRCDGTCVRFTSEKCLAKRANSREYEMLFNVGNKAGPRASGMLLVAAVLGTGIFF